MDDHARETATEFANLIRGVAARIDQLDEVHGNSEDDVWSRLVLSELKKLREAELDTERRLALHITSRKILTPPRAGAALGYSANAVYNWLKAADSEAV